jgi:hypothetical protein
MTTTPETWTRYPRSTDPAKDWIALAMRLTHLKSRARLLADIIKDGYSYAAEETSDSVLDLCTILDREHQEWIAQRGVEAVRKAVMPDGEWE